MNDRLSGRTLYCSLPLARILTVGEFTAIVGHELGHFRGDDTKFSKRFYPIYRGAGDALLGLQAAGGEGAGVLALLPAMAVFNFFLAAFAVAESRLGRERELIADRAGASVTSDRAMATSLVKVHAHAGVWRLVQLAVIEGMQQGKSSRMRARCSPTPSRREPAATRWPRYRKWSSLTPPTRTRPCPSAWTRFASAWRA